VGASYSDPPQAPKMMTAHTTSSTSTLINTRLTADPTRMHWSIDEHPKPWTDEIVRDADVIIAPSVSCELQGQFSR
jgi:hypothetical protein